MKSYLQKLCDSGSLVELYLDPDDVDTFDVGIICGVGDECFSSLTISKSGGLSSTIVRKIDDVLLVATDSAYLKLVSSLIEVGLESVLTLSKKGRYLPPDIKEALGRLEENARFATLLFQSVDLTAIQWTFEGEIIVCKGLDSRSGQVETVALRFADLEGLGAFSPKLIALETCGLYTNKD